MLQDAFRPKITIYACGGLGINLGHELEKYRAEVETACAALEIFYADTSRSNLKHDTPENRFFLIEGKDGSGKVRSENASSIVERIPSLLIKFKPSDDLSIVLSSASGGTGSVIASSLVSELLERGKRVVCITVGTKTSKLEISNTIKTIKTYESIARLRKKPVVMFYAENSGVNRKDSDNDVRRVVISLALLFSHANAELDTADLANWLDYEKVTSFSYNLVGLEIVDNLDEIKNKDDIISLATLTLPEWETDTQTGVEYQCTGYMPVDFTQSSQITKPKYFAIVYGHYSELASKLKEAERSLNEKAQARIVKSRVMDEDDNSESNGLIL